MDIYTAQLRYSGPDRLDITVKGQDPFGKYFAPTWPMVRGLKNKTLSEEDYTKRYHELLMAVGPAIWSALAIRLKTAGSITLVCYCSSGAFCHRLILADVMEKMGLGEYKGERKL